MRLVSGSGSPETGACWMSAVNWYVYSGHRGFVWSDHPACVDPIIRAFCIWLNDRCANGEREDLIGPHLFAPVGTWQGHSLMQERAFTVADWVVRIITPRALRVVHKYTEARILETLPAVRDIKTAREAAKVADDARVLYAADVAYIAAKAVGDAEAYASDVAYTVGGVADDAHLAYGITKREILDLILRLCRMGVGDVEPSRTQDEMRKCLESGFCGR